MRDIAERVLAFSAGLREDEEFPSEVEMKSTLALLDRKPVVAVVGDTGAGKSSVLDLLTGFSFFSRSGIPGMARLWTYASYAGDFNYDGVDVKYFPDESLSGIELLDTKGTDTFDSPVQMVQMLSEVDVLIYVVDARRFNEAQSWRFLAHLPDELYSRMVIAVTREDLFDFERQQAIKNEIRQQAELHFGVDVPLYMLRAGGEFKGQGGEALARRIQSILDQASVYSRIEESLLQVSRILLGEQKHVLNNQDMLRRLDSGFLHSIENEIDAMQNRITGDMAARVQTAGHFVKECIPALAKKSAHQLGFYLSIKRQSYLGRMAWYIDNWFYEYIRKGIEEQQEYHNREFMVMCRDHWNSVRPRVKDQMNCEIGAFPEEDVRSRLDIYRRRLGRAAYGPLLDFGIKPCLAKLFVSQKKWMKRQLVMVLSLIIVAGLLGGLGESIAGAATLGFAAFLWVFAGFMLIFVRRRMVSQIISAAEDIHIAVQAGMKEAIYEANLSGVADYRKLYTNIRGYVAINANQIEPLLEEHNRLFYRLSVLTRRA